MKIDKYAIGDYGEVFFAVDENIYVRVMDHLQSKGISVSNKHTGDLVDLCVLVSIEQLNRELADFSETS